AALVVAERDRCVRLRDLHPEEHLAIPERDGESLEARRDRAARLDDRFDDVHLREAATESAQLRADALARIADAMTLDAERLLGVHEELPAALRIAGTRQGRVGEPFLLRAALASEADLHLGGLLRLGQPNENAISSLRQRRLEAIGIRTDDA